MVDTYFTKNFLIKAHMIVSTSKIILEFTVTMIISAEYLTCIIIFQVSSTVQKIQIRRFSGYSFPIPTIYPPPQRFRCPIQITPVSKFVIDHLDCRCGYSVISSTFLPTSTFFLYSLTKTFVLLNRHCVSPGYGSLDLCFAFIFSRMLCCVSAFVVFFPRIYPPRGSVSASLNMLPVQTDPATVFPQDLK